MKTKCALALIVLLASACVGACAGDAYNDHMFPPAPGARSAINFDTHGFLIHGKRVFLVSAGMEYARVPRALWHDRLLRLKRAGFNCVEMYTFWNSHEPQEGQFDFSGDHDLDAYLKLIKKMGMYAIVRVGPYCCAEWDSGGYPIWLRFKPGLQVRVDNAPFEKAVDKFFDRLIPIVAANQINRGGSVILVQLENEYPLGWTHTPSEGYGTNIPNRYFQNLHDTAVALGIQVPFFFSGMHHGSDPAEYNGGRSLDDPTRPNPWITTEFWSVWFSNYGQPPSDTSGYGSEAATYSRRTWRILANGGNGYNIYMGHGGSNFGYTNCDVDAASYDYGAAVGQAGDLRPTYYAFKRVGLFARSFQDILENSHDDPEGGVGVATNPAVNVLTRVGPVGTIRFLDNPAKMAVQTQVRPPQATGLPASVTVTLAPGELMPVVSGFGLCPGVTLTWAPTRILGVASQGQTKTLVIYGAPGTPAELYFSGTKPLRVTMGASHLEADGADRLVLRDIFSAGQPRVYAFSAGKSEIRIVSVSDTLADHTWFVDTGGSTYVVCGPDYVGEAALTHEGLSLVAEQPWALPAGADRAPSTSAAWAYGPTGAVRLSATQARPPVHPSQLTLGTWEVKSAVPASSLPPDDRGWMASREPQQMGADGDLTADAWYRTTLRVPEAGTEILDFAAAGDRLSVSLDGTRMSQDRAPRNSLVFDAAAGRHTLTVFTAHDGRPDFFPYLGPIFSKYAKGLLGPAVLSRLVAGPTPVGGWRVLNLPGDPGASASPPAADAAGWRDYKPGDSVFHNSPGFAWFETQITADNGGGRRTSLHCDSIDNNGVVFLNGTRLPGRHGVNEPFDVPLGSGANTVAILVENSYDTGGLSSTTLVTRSGTALPVTGWFLRGGPGDPSAPMGWRPLAPADAFTGPAFFRTTFNAEPPAPLGAHPIWRVVSRGLGHGSVWVNGHNLGRYPEKIPINGLYIPECWLAHGKNTLIIYDEDGRRPNQVTISAETAASRDVFPMVVSR